MAKVKRIRHHKSIYRLNISFLDEIFFGKFPILGKNTKREANLSPKLETLKERILELILACQGPKGLSKYCIAWETHQSNGLAHLDILLKYQNNVRKSFSSFNYLLAYCPQKLQLLPDNKPRVNITSYCLSKISQAIVEYGEKEDPEPLNTFTNADTKHHLVLAAIKRDPYTYFRKEMQKDPYNFDLSECAENCGLDGHVPNWSAIKHKLHDIRSAMISRLELEKPGIEYITRSLIEEKLTSAELKVFDEHPCFQIIVDYINQITDFTWKRPHKTSNLFIWGPKNIGKTALFLELGKYIGYYTVKIENKYINRYSNNKYGFILWNETKLTDFTHTWILEFLEGMPTSIPMRYNSCIKRDNPLVVMTSNLSLEQHIKNRYGDRLDLYNHAKQNLGCRITDVHVPIPMFFMQKLLIQKN